MDNVLSMHLNFGDRLFTHNINGAPFDQILQISSSKGVLFINLWKDFPKIIETDERDKGPKDDDEKKQMVYLRMS